MNLACLLVPNFAVAIARRDRSDLRAKPVIIGGSPEEHAAVTACSEEAAAAGVTVGTTLRRALTLCPRAVFLPVKAAQLATEGARLLEFLQVYSPLVEEVDAGHLHFDVRGLARMSGMDEAEYLAELHESACSSSGLLVRLGVGETVFTAHAAATVCQDGALRVVEPEESKTFLAGLPVDVLPMPPQMHERMRLLGIEWLAQLAALPFSAVQAQFGPAGRRAWELAHGKDDSFVTPKREEVKVSAEVELPAPTSLSAPLIVGTQTLLERALNQAEIRGQSVRRLDWRLELENGERLTRKFVFREPTNDAFRMLSVVKEKVERLQLSAPGVSLGVTLSGLCSEYGHQGNLWRTGPRRRRELLDAVEQLTTREGEPQVFQIVEVEPWSRIPERQVGLVAFGG